MLISQVFLCFSQVSLHLLKIGLGRIELAHQVRFVKFGYHLPFLDHAVIVYIQFTDDARHLSTNGNTRHRLYRSRCRDAALNIGRSHFLRDKINLFLSLRT